MSNLYGADEWKMWQAQPITFGTYDPKRRPAATNPDGGYSTIRSMSFQDDSGKEILVPTVLDGKFMSPEEAINSYRKTGYHLGMYNSPAEATAASQVLHEQEAAKIETPLMIAKALGINPNKLSLDSVPQALRGYQP